MYSGDLICLKVNFSADIACICLLFATKLQNICFLSACLVYSFLKMIGSILQFGVTGDF